MNYLILIIVAVGGFAVGRKTAKLARPTSGTFTPNQPKADGHVPKKRKIWREKIAGFCDELKIDKPF